MQYGKAEGNILKAHISSKIPLPKWALEAPELHPGLEFTFSAFFELSSDRASGFGPGPIPFRSIMDYAKWHGLDEDDTEDFAHHIREMDKAFLAYNQETH